MRRHWPLAFFYAAIALLGLSTSCGQPLPPIPTREAVFAAFGIKVNPGRDEDEGSPVLPPLNLYIDGSESMKPFVTDPSSTYVQVLRQLLEKAATARYPLNAYKFSSEVIPIHRILSSQVVSPSFYNGTDTPLAGLLTRIADDARRQRLSVVISDLVQSERGEDQLSLVSAFQKIAENEPEVLLMAFRSRYHGKYFIETFPKGTLQLNLDERNPGEGRPFYLLVTAPSSKDLRQFEEYVLAGLGGKEVFRASAPPLIAKKVELSPSEKGSVWNRYGALEIMPNRYDSTRLIGAFVERHTPQGPVSTLRLHLGGQSVVPMMSWAKFRYQTQRATFQVGKMDPQPTSIDWRPTAEGEQGGESGTTIFTYPFPRPAPRTWDVYRIQIQAGKANLALPTWVGEWSTKSDRDPKNGNRTLHLDLLVEAMVRAITEDAVFLDQFILLGRGD